MTTLRRLALCVAVLAAGAVRGPAPAGADQPGCEGEEYDAAGKCLVRNDPDETGEGGSPGGGGAWICIWTGPLDGETGRSTWPDAPNFVSYWLFRDCGTGGGNGTYDPWERVGYLAGGPWGWTMEIVPGPVDPPAPGRVADDLWAEVAAMLPAPSPVVSPPAGVASIVDEPTFVAVANWTEIDGASDCDDVVGLVCVTLDAVPHLTFDPGDGGDVVECAGSGTRYDPSGPPPDVQAAAEGACVHAYPRRTGAGDRPAAWHGTVTVSWAVSWTSANPDASGTFPDFALSTAIDRPVDEVQGVLVEGRG